MNPLPKQRNRSPPRAILISSTQTTANKPIPKLTNKILVPKTSTGTTHPRQPKGKTFQWQLKSYGQYPVLKPFSKTRKFAEFSAGEQVAMGRATVPPLTLNPSRQATLESANTGVVIPRDYLPPVQSFSMESISPSVGQPTTQSREDPITSPNLQYPSTFSNPEILSTPLQQPGNSESNAPVSNWRQALVSSCVVGVAAFAVVAGYACCTAIRGVVNVGHFVYANRENIQQTCTTCSRAVQSTYDAAKRRMVSVPNLPIGVRRRYAPSPQPQGRSRQRHFFRQRRIPEQPSQSPNAVISALPSDRMEGVEYSVVSEATPIPVGIDTVTSKSHRNSPTSHSRASDLPRMTGALFVEPFPSSVPNHPANSFLSGVITPFGTNWPPKDKFPNESLMSLNDPQAWMASPEYHSRPSQTASFAATRLIEELEEVSSPHVTFYESPRTGRPVNRTKKFIKGEPMDFPVDDSTLNASPAIGSFESPTQQEQDAMDLQTDGPVRHISPAPYLAPTVYSLRGPTKAKGRNLKAGIEKIRTKLPQEEEALESAERARLVCKSLSKATRHKNQNPPRAAKQAFLN